MKRTSRTRSSRNDLLELGHAPAPLLCVVGGVGEVAGEDDEVRLPLERVDRGDRAPQGRRRLRVHRGPAKAPMRVRQLDEEEILLLGEGRAAQAGSEDDPAESGEPEEIPAYQVRGEDLWSRMRSPLLAFARGSVGPSPRSASVSWSTCRPGARGAHSLTILRQNRE
jgi:hypothetical protein